MAARKPVFKKGDTVVHPEHGAAIVEDLAKREFMGETRTYLKLRVVHGDLIISVPVESFTEVGLRPPISKNKVKEVLKVLKEDESSEATNWSRRFKLNIEKLRSGDIFEVAEVVKNLSIRDRDKGLSAGEKRMVVKARQILISELMFAQDITEEKTTEMVDKVLDDSHGAREVAQA